MKNRLRRFFTLLISKAFLLLGRLFPKPDSIWQHLRQNLIVGLIVMGLLIVFQNTDAIRATREESIDWLIRMNRGVDFSSGGAPRPFVFYDIDDRSQQVWGEPLLTPRDKLATLIAAALEKQPSVLIVDVELWKSTPEDSALIAVLRKHAELTEAPRIVLVQSFRWNEQESGKGYWLTRRSFIEHMLPPSRNRIWASPLFEQDKDGQYRRWRNWLSACSDSEEQIVVPSVQVSVLAELAGDSALGGLRQALQGIPSRGCTDETKLSASVIQIGGRQINVTADAFTQRILFALPWKLAANETRPEIGFGGRKVRLLSILPAHAVTEGGVRTSLPAGHIAIIGASNQDARDVHATPLGMMPGSLILINAIHSLLKHGQMTTPPVWIQFLAAIILLSGMSYVFMRFPSFLGVTISLGSVVLILVPISMYFFRYGIWLDFAFPIVTVKFFELAMTHLRRHIHDRKPLKNE